MKLRYYLRGLGIGMIVTALLMGIALKKQPLSDAEIRVRAMELGMVDGDSRTLAGNQASQDSGQASPDPTAVSSTEPTATPSPEPTTVPAVTPIPVETPSSGSEPDALKPLPMVTLKPQVETPEPADAASVPDPARESASEQSDSVTFVIQRGQSSYGVAKALAEAGLLEDASAFDQYLESNGYSKRINSGTYEIPADSTEEDIAKIITRSR